MQIIKARKKKIHISRIFEPVLCVKNFSLVCISVFCMAKIRLFVKYICEWVGACVCVCVCVCSCDLFFILSEET